MQTGAEVAVGEEADAVFGAGDDDRLADGAQVRTDAAELG